MTVVASSAGRVARAINVRGLVQGVGYRPFVHRLAIQSGVGGFVRNESGAVYIEIEGTPESVAMFLERLQSTHPPAARLDTIDVRPGRIMHRHRFHIDASRCSDDQRLPVAPDLAMCAACKDELLDPGNRRYEYPFITCTDCGPRYTTILAMPYDRVRTTMNAFTQCPTCREEFEDPTNRRYHSQTNSCFACGPSLQLLDDCGRVITSAGNALSYTAHAIGRGDIVAIRGLGGFHLAVDAANESAIRRLRLRKGRDAKPLAVMVATVDEAASLGYVSQADARLLESPERPILVLRRRADAPLAPSVSPGLNTIGVMVAYTPLHYLLLDKVARPVVMTSGNVSDEPICTDNAEALRRLAGIADMFLVHDREISSRYDDSVVRTVVDHGVFVRRSRGYAPMPLTMPVQAPIPLVAVGPHLKNTFTLASGNTAYVSQHIGDLENLETLEHFRTAYDTYRHLFNLDPIGVAHDLHPGYLSTKIATDFGFEFVVPVQHHHAHVAAVAAEHHVNAPVIGFAFDGTGYGDDGCVWGGEIMLADLSTYRRVGHLRYAAIPGGDAAARMPWRSALGFLSLQTGLDAWCSRLFAAVSAEEISVARQQIVCGLNTHQSSSMGRLFDAAAAIVGLRSYAGFEGQAAMELESAAGKIVADPVPMRLAEDASGWIMDPLPVLIALAEGATAKKDVGFLAAQFHESVAVTAVQVAREVRDEFGVNHVVLSGGVFQNARLLSSMTRQLRQQNFDVLIPRLLGPNDGAISYGQAVVAAATLSGNGAN